MEDRFPNICDNCRQRPATRLKFLGGEEQQFLCATCFEELASQDELDEVQRVKRLFATTKCKYCGDPAAGVSVACAIEGVYDDVIEGWCARCSADLKEFSQRPENVIPDFDPDDDDTDEMCRLMEERGRRRDEFMRERIQAGRGSKRLMVTQLLPKPTRLLRLHFSR